MAAYTLFIVNRRVILSLIIGLLSATAVLAQQTPYGGSPHPIPGKIEAEDFDLGGAGVAYHDTNIENAGHEYRDTSVDIETCSEGGFDVGWIDPGEWLEYTVDVAQSGLYVIEVRVASLSEGGDLHIEFDGIDVTSTQHLAATGGWQTWTTLVIPVVTLPQGRQVMRVVFESRGFNVNYIEVISAQARIASVVEALDQMTRDLKGEIVLSQAEEEQYLEDMKSGVALSAIDEIYDALFLYTDTYESRNSPLYHDGVVHHDHELPIHAQALLFIQSAMFEKWFVPGKIDNVAGIVFEHHKVIPGSVPADTPRIAQATVEVNGTYYTDIAAEIGDQTRVVRPTGYYVAPGDIVIISVPPHIAGKGLSINVGAHFRNMDPGYIGKINRFKDISAEYPLNATQIKVANPFGGGIYLKVPDGSNAGWFELTIKNAIKSPYFSYRQGRETDVAQWIDELNASGAPWADFESDKYMFTIPTVDVIGLTNPDEIMAQWDANLDGYRIVAGRPLERIRAEYYMLDTRLVTPAYGAGYPLVIPLAEYYGHGSSGWNPLKVLEFPPSNTLFHEMGHNHLHPTMNYGVPELPCHALEAETINHVPSVFIYNVIYGMTIQDAMAQSFGSDLTLNQAAFDWIITHNFRNNLRMFEDPTAPMPDKNQLHYQPRSWGKYVDIARQFGWDSLGMVNGYFYHPGEPQSGTVCSWRPFVVGRDEYIKAASEVLGVNMAPLFHFWGINPSATLANELAKMPKSQKAKELIENYLCEVAPGNKAEYMVYHRAMYDKMGYQQPRYDQYIQQFDEDFAADIAAQFNFLLNTYGLIGPASPSALQAEIVGQDVTLIWQDNSNDETGFVIKQRTAPDSPFETLATVGSNTTSFTLSGLADGIYDIMVTAKYADGMESNLCEAQIVSIESIDGVIYLLGKGEGFETGDFGELDWDVWGDSYWFVTQGGMAPGQYCVQAGDIEDGQTSTLTVTLDCSDGDITFYCKVSSESDYDYLDFYIDGVEQDDWSGEQDWKQVSFPVEAGTHTFRWTYSKDGSGSSGDDTAWLDDIVLPFK